MEFELSDEPAGYWYEGDYGKAALANRRAMDRWPGLGAADRGAADQAVFIPEQEDG